MARGFIRGMLWGAGVSLAAVTLISIVGEGPQPQTQADQTTQKAGVADATTATNPRALGDGVPVAALNSSKSAPPQPDTLAGLSGTAITSAAVPQTGKPSDLQGIALPQSTALSGISAPQTEAPRVNYAETTSLATPSTETGVSVSVEPAQPLPPEPVNESSAFAQTGDPASAEVEPAPQDSGPAVLTDIPAPAAPQTAQVETSISVDPAQPTVPNVPTASGAFDTDTPAEETAQVSLLPAKESESPTVMTRAQDIEVAALSPEVQSKPATVLSDEAPQVTAALQVPETMPEVVTASPDVSAEPAAPAPGQVSDLVAPNPADETQKAGESATAQVQAKPSVATPAVQTPLETDAVIATVIEPAPEPQPAKPLPVLDVSTASDVSDAAQETAAPVVVAAAPKTVRVNRLPTLGTPVETETTPEAEPEEVAVLEDVQSETTVRPVEAFSVAVENPDEKPVMAVVLLDQGGDTEAKATGLAALRDLPYPVSFAVNAMLPDAADRMAAYRRAGFEVLAMIDFPEGSTARDAEVNLSVALQAVPEAVGVLEGVTTGVQTTPDAGRQVAQILAQTGHGLVTQNRGLNTVQKLAARQGVPSGVVFRDFDSQGQDARIIRRFMDQAAFRAGQEGAVIMLGRLREETLSALLLWTLQDRASSVAMVPVSAALRTQ